ncbi:hypothetical protein RND81_10G093800 [Saponaria officinalis]|uniref:Uncharacterized protein n=1 Tax=Saponaria officinalis TaxID=3572 RepID=A0AAW1HZH1_SAPOF
MESCAGSRFGKFVSWRCNDFCLAHFATSAFDLIAEELLMSNSLIKVYGALRMTVKMHLMLNSKITIEGNGDSIVSTSLLETGNLFVLKLPQAQLEGALKKIGALKAPLATHASQPNVKATLPRSILVVLSIASDPQVESHSQAGQPEVVDAGNSKKDNNAVNTNESSSGG